MALSILPVARDFTIFAGATFSQSFRWVVGGEPVDLTGWDAWMPYGLNVKTPLGELSKTAGTIALGSDGKIDLYMTDEQTTVFGANVQFPKINGVAQLIYQLSLQNDAGEILRYMRGNLYVQYDIGRPTP